MIHASADRARRVRYILYSVAALISLGLLSGCETTGTSSTPANLATDEIRALEADSRKLGLFATTNDKNLTAVAKLAAALPKDDPDPDVVELRDKLDLAMAALQDAQQQAQSARDKKNTRRDALVAKAKADAERRSKELAQRRAEEKRRSAEEATARKAAEQQQKQLAREKAALEKLRRDQEARRRKLQLEKEKREQALAKARADAAAAAKTAEKRKQEELRRIADMRSKQKQELASEEQATIADAERRLAKLREEFEAEERRILAEREQAIAKLDKKQQAADQELAEEEKRLQAELAAQEKRVQAALAEAQRRDAEVSKLIKTETQEWSANLRALEGKLRSLEQANRTYLIRELVVTGDRDAVRNLSSWLGYQGYANQELAVGDMEAIRERLASDLRKAGYKTVNVEISEPSLDLGFLKFRVTAKR